MGKVLQCKKCSLSLGEIEKGKIRRNTVCLCSDCWDKADIAIRMAEMASQQGRNLYKGKEDEVVASLMDMLGMR